LENVQIKNAEELTVRRHKKGNACRRLRKQRHKAQKKYNTAYVVSVWLFTKVKVHTHRTRFDNATRFFDFHWPITLILVWIFQIFRSAITFWVIRSTYLSKFALIGCFINFQKLKNRVALSNRVWCVWTLRYFNFTLSFLKIIFPPDVFNHVYYRF
jgi:hypothetical protein